MALLGYSSSVTATARLVDKCHRDHLGDPFFIAPDPACGSSVNFEPGVRTAWHTHPLGQTLIVTAGVGRAQREGGAD